MGGRFIILKGSEIIKNNINLGELPPSQINDNQLIYPISNPAEECLEKTFWKKFHFGD
jgi:hypothetical protein